MTGLTRLATVRVTRSSAEQRRGRAGRTGPGVCYRLWSAHEDHGLVPYATPEILEADLVPLALQLAATGVLDATTLSWLDPPPAPALTEARRLLTQLGALNDAGAITSHGQAMARLSVHPRLAHMLLRGKELGRGGLAANLTALLEERDLFPWHEGGLPDPDIRLRLEALQRGGPADPTRVHRVRAESRLLQRDLGIGREPRRPVEPEAAGLLLAFAYPDRIARRRTGQAGRFLLRSGQGAKLDSPRLGASEFVVAAELDGVRRDARVLLAAPLDRGDLERYFGEQLATEELVEWDEGTQRIESVRRVTLGAIVLDEGPVAQPEVERVRLAWKDLLRREGLGVVAWSASALRLRNRLAFLHWVDPRWPDASDECLRVGLEEWLLPRLDRARSREDLARVDLTAFLLDRLSWDQRRDLDALAPTHVMLPSGSRAEIDYSDPTSPVLAAKLQELFGREDTPTVAGGRVRLTLHLLSPAGRPVQVTQDLRGFWRGSYRDVRKDMKGRYPKHDWPEEPWRALAHRGIHRRQ